MPRIANLTGALLIGMLIAGCTSPMQQGSIATPGGACFLASDVEAWSEVGLGNFVLRTRRDEYYYSRVGGDCIDVDFAQQIAIQPQRGISQICEGTNAQIYTRDLDGRRPRQCYAFNFRRLSPAEVAGLPEAARNRLR